MEPNLIKPKNDEYTRHLKLTEQELAELKRASQEATVLLEAHYRAKCAADRAKEAKTEKRA